MTVTHVLNEARSPVEGVVWTMWCGEQCLVDDDGVTTPYVDFYMEKQAGMSDCAPCRGAHAAGVKVGSAEVPA